MKMPFSNCSTEPDFFWRHLFISHNCEAKSIVAIKRVHVLVTGRVQGVFFRAYTKDRADELQLRGWVRNLADGRVEACIEGEASAVTRMLHWFGQGGSPHAVVTDVTQRELAGSCGTEPFAIRSTVGRPMD